MSLSLAVAVRATDGEKQEDIRSLWMSPPPHPSIISYHIACSHAHAGKAVGTRQLRITHAVRAQARTPTTTHTRAAAAVSITLTHKPTLSCTSAPKWQLRADQAGQRIEGGGWAEEDGAARRPSHRFCKTSSSRFTRKTRSPRLGGRRGYSSCARAPGQSSKTGAPAEATCHPGGVLGPVRARDRGALLRYNYTSSSLIPRPTS